MLRVSAFLPADLFFLPIWPRSFDWTRQQCLPLLPTSGRWLWAGAGAAVITHITHTFWKLQLFAPTTTRPFQNKTQAAFTLRFCNLNYSQDTFVENYHVLYCSFWTSMVTSQLSQRWGFCCFLLFRFWKLVTSLYWNLKANTVCIQYITLHAYSIFKLMLIYSHIDEIL